MRFIFDSTRGTLPDHRLIVLSRSVEWWCMAAFGRWSDLVDSVTGRDRSCPVESKRTGRAVLGIHLCAHHTPIKAPFQYKRSAGNEYLLPCAMSTKGIGLLETRFFWGKLSSETASGFEVDTSKQSQHESACQLRDRTEWRSMYKSNLLLQCSTVKPSRTTAMRQPPSSQSSPSVVPT